MGYFGDRETLEWVLDTVEEEGKVTGTKEVTPATPFQTPQKDNGTRNGEESNCLGTAFANSSTDTTGNIFVCERPVSHKMMPTSEMQCAPTPKMSNSMG